jgi:hypothetical protein
MYHKNLDDTHDNVFPKFKITEEEKKVIRKAVKSYKINKFKNQVIREGKERWSSKRYLEKYPDYFQEHGKNKLRSKGKSPGEILDDYFVKIGKPTNCKRWYNLARCVIAIGEYEEDLKPGS